MAKFTFSFEIEPVLHFRPDSVPKCLHADIRNPIRKRGR